MPQHVLTQLPAFAESGAINMIVESPRGSKVKLKFDSGLGCFRIGRALGLGIAYPYDWGFVPNTVAKDGDPVDAMLIAEFATYPGVLVECEPLGVLQISQPSRQDDENEQRVQNNRVILVPSHAPRERAIWTELPPRVRAELEVFFLSAVGLDKDGVQIAGWQSAEAARDLITRSLSQ